MAAQPDLDRAAAAVRELLSALGLAPDSAELETTPQTVAASMAEMISGVQQDPEQPLRAALFPVSDGRAGQLVAITGLRVRSLCEHHLLPFWCTINVVYDPCEQLAGLGSIARAAEILGARPQLQERLGEQLAAALISATGAAGALVTIFAKQGCLRDRGAKQREASSTSLAAVGTLAAPEAQSAAFELLRLSAGTDTAEIELPEDTA